MKKIFNWLLLPLMMLLGACTQEEIVFDHEQPAFETKDGMILLEVIVPSSTKADDVIYISGAFNGGDEVAAKDVRWHLEKSTTIDKKWGIYLDPSAFESGKTLADGYRFVSVREGEERTAKNEAVNRTEDFAPGTRANIYVSYWNMFFYVAPELEHDGPVVYVNNQTSWDALALYAWGDAEAFGGWPGMQPTGEIAIDGTNWTYFDLGEANRGLNLNLIFNNNGNGSQLADYNVTLDKDEYFLTITDEGVEVANSIPSHEGTIRVYVDNQAGWEAVALYQWGDVNDLGGGWPGVQPAGTAKIAGVEYTYFEYAIADVEGLAQNLIFNNNGAGIQTGDMAVTFSADVVDHFFLIYGEKDCIVIEDPFNREPVGGDEGGDEGGNEGGETGGCGCDCEGCQDCTGKENGEEPEVPAEPVPVVFYIQNNTGWEATSIYAWGDALPELFGGWPGAAVENNLTCGGVAYSRIETTATAYGLEYHPIFNNNGAGTQYDAPVVALAEYNFLVAGAEAAEIGAAPAVKVYVDDQTGWEGIAMYSWGDINDVVGGWPGVACTVETVDGKEYKVFEIPAEGFATSCNLIFNNNGAGVQLADYNIKADRDIFLTVTAEGVTPIE
ncbi:MAG: starch-binding protein [Bacteroidales bacterium]|nr:starch-binding protein [Bacteroidales bacterium]